MTEHQIVVVFDVTAETRELAAMAVAGVLSDDGIESWWFPEADLKHIDRNDNPAGRLVFAPAPHCIRCGTPHEPMEYLGTGLWPACECAGDPPVDRDGDDWAAYLVRVARLRTAAVSA